jgi:hypothetical protein
MGKLDVMMEIITWAVVDVSSVTSSSVRAPSFKI